jgi:hypothetical protein
VFSTGKKPKLKLLPFWKVLWENEHYRSTFCSKHEINFNSLKGGCPTCIIEADFAKKVIGKAKNKRKQDMKMDKYLYVVIESGGVTFDPKILGIYRNEILAKDKVKDALVDFLKQSQNPVVTKDTVSNYTYFQVFDSEEDIEFGDYINVFAIAKIDSSGIK